ncbi:hypothetical protein EXIGUO8H_40219 [Exiguobacterium sp. 8H]|nr:hypothetical protein EXIGUO8H_40219 [Exiguobacterium sp. 8H]
MCPHSLFEIGYMFYYTHDLFHVYT